MSICSYVQRVFLSGFTRIIEGVARPDAAEPTPDGASLATDAAGTFEACCGVNVPGPLPDEKVLSRVTAQLKGFADPTRLKILCLIADRETCVHDLVTALGISQSGVSHQLRALREADLVVGRRKGRHVYYGLADDHVRSMLSNALSHGAEGSSGSATS